MIGGKVASHDSAEFVVDLDVLDWISSELEISRSEWFDRFSKLMYLIPGSKIMRGVHSSGIDSKFETGLIVEEVK